MKHFIEVEIDEETDEYYFSNIATELFDSEVTLMSNEEPTM